MRGAAGFSIFSTGIILVAGVGIEEDATDMVVVFAVDEVVAVDSWALAASFLDFFLLLAFGESITTASESFAAATTAGLSCFMIVVDFTLDSTVETEFTTGATVLGTVVASTIAEDVGASGAEDNFVLEFFKIIRWVKKCYFI